MLKGVFFAFYNFSFFGCFFSLLLLVQQADVQNAALAGGVGIGSVASLIVRPWIALVIGFMSGSIAVVGYTHVQVKIGHIKKFLLPSQNVSSPCIILCCC